MEENYIIFFLLLVILLYINHDQDLKNYNNPNTLFFHLSNVSNILKKHNIKHWIMYGTLLGAVRQKDIIPYDYDFDIGAYVDDVQKILNLNKYIKSKGYFFYKPYNYFSKIKTNVWRVSLKIKYKGIIMGDIYLYTKFKDGFMRRFDTKQGIYFWPKGTFPSWHTDELKMIKIRDKYFPGPRNPEILLEYWYGSSWKIPLKAKSQGGKSINGIDFYGGAIDPKLRYFYNFSFYKNLNKLPTIDKPIHFIFPKEQKVWISKNEIINY